MILHDRPVRDDTGKLLVILSINELCEGMPVELWLRKGRVVVRAYNEAGCNATEVDVMELMAALQGGCGAIDIENLEPFKCQ